MNRASTGVDDPAEVPGDQADGHARDRADRGGDEAHEQRDARAVQDPDEQVTAGAVGAQPEPGGARGHRVARRVLAGVRVGDVRRVVGDRDEQGRGDGEHDHDSG